jgi:ribosomal protein S27AE
VSSVKEDIVRDAVCAKCGMGVAIGGEENRVVCTGCQKPTDICTCSG